VRKTAGLEAILEATARLLVREGCERTTTNRIAEVAGVSVGSLYQFFPSKHALFTALRRRYYDHSFGCSPNSTSCDHNRCSRRP
jgi:AcrR family transcriptional regulator